MRIQSSWILETASKLENINSIYFPYIDKYSSLLWLKDRCLPTVVNSSINSMTTVLHSYVDKYSVPFTDKNKRKFNQYLAKPLDIEMNPFKKWKDKHFTREQLDYLFYWHEAGLEIELEQQRSIFWSSVHLIMSYWIHCRKDKHNCHFKPDQIMEYILNRHKVEILRESGEIEVKDQPVAEFSEIENSLTVIPLLIEDDYNQDLDSFFHAWFNGHSDIDMAKKDIFTQNNKFIVGFDKKINAESYMKISSGSKIVSFVWTGKGLPPAVYSSSFVEPLREAFATVFHTSKLNIKCVNHRLDEYDYLLTFFDKKT